MSQADFTARIKKIEILNKYTAESWKQSIRVILDEIELSDENLLELRQFSPNEEVQVVLSSLQRGLFDEMADDDATRADAPVAAPTAQAEELASAEDCDGAFVTVQEGPFTPAAAALRSWSFEQEPGDSK